MKQLELLLDYLFTQQRWVIHGLFWLLILVFYVVFFGRENSNYIQTFFFVGLLMPVTIGTTYFLNYYLVPRYLMKERYGFFLLYFVYTLIGSIFLEMMIAMLTFIVMAEVNIKEMSPASIDIFFLLTSLLMVVFFGVAIKMLLHWRKSKDDYQQLMRDKVETELKFLKVQLNPHFLFNTLNNLYYLTTEKSDKAPQAILQLSEILDYVMHSSRSVFVPLEKELKQVENYIALELLRYEDRVQVTTKFSGDLNKYEIGPMILITLIENAFKHGVMPIAGKAWINLTVAGKENRLVISISNSAISAKSGNGIGLENLQSQLGHLYKGEYSMEVVNKVGEFSINLILNQKK
ncbi:MAG TPA: histidine kinase [Cyclobacteriaceae bacterium]|nr:histidine kinase [Cyclobacteriaceae bacterium]HPW63850.1 histidine kinase [Cyclobacteriaceae bacterium]